MVGSQLGLTKTENWASMDFHVRSVLRAELPGVSFDVRKKNAGFPDETPQKKSALLNCSFGVSAIRSVVVTPNESHLSSNLLRRPFTRSDAFSGLSSVVPMPQQEKAADNSHPDTPAEEHAETRNVLRVVPNENEHVRNKCRSATKHESRP
jgi:hypothetical protein